ncbi:MULTISPECIES: helix-turn-helix transcriptional regulator [Paenibacillus]|uniref:Transcriptional regulator, AraC family n=2 Tax=Paenibacillus lactis TaxID=228574 RepID=G4H8Z6_9BACL|nr:MULTISPECIES: AraC family transcriptional regulator [Paenibacillus]EHB68331.1 transcriptional regulator, AraC family [Paenibacillus lactis 154]MBP1894282.1 AraC-like DNA-binding protein [Paenibacillus lactis]MCM3497563.1 AraC family transcriptional regulator [Paenibacillus lactis]HAF99543.1 AraC family transcriptional regulator [Paenibacillus lactis]
MAVEASEYPLQRLAPVQQWSPSIHYAQLQRMGTGALPQRRLYDFELLYVSQGEAVTTMYGKRHVIEAGQLIFLPSGVYHQNEVTSIPEAHFLGIHFDFFGELEIQTEADMIVNEAAVAADKFAREAISEVFPPLSSRTIYTPPLSCVQLMERVVEEFTLRPAGYELVCKGLMLDILVQLFRTHSSQALTETSPHDGKLMDLMARIEKAPAEDWSNKRIAAHLMLSPDHTAKLFKRLAGMPPSEFVQSVRHREARRLLRETDLSIEAIGDRIGYPDIHYFSRIFRKLEGITATDYRKLSRIL